jgi:hypothetical protein
MLAFVPDWSTSEWTSVVGILFAALAAAASWRSVAISLALQRAARVPQVSGAVLHGVPSGRLTLTFANAGPVLAVQVVYMLVAEGVKRGGIVGEGHLAVGEKITFDPNVPVSASVTGPAHLVWGWRDLDDNVYFKASDWTGRRFSRRAYLRREDTSLGGMFREMYPDVPMPG